MCMQIDKKRAQKKVDVRKAWVGKYGDIEKDVEAFDTASEEMGVAEIEYERDADERNIDDEDVDDGDDSQAEECPEEEGVELTEEDKRGIFERLHGVWAAQRMEAQELLNDLENAGCGKEDNETPEDWAFRE
jgi:hypothetical protein